MSTIDVERLLQPVSDESPCGVDLEYDAAYLAMTRAAAGRPAQEIGNAVAEGEEPDWRAVEDACIELLGRSKDLRIAVYLTRALLGTKGIEGFADGLALTRALIERYWEPVHPRLDPDDDNDPTIRVNTIGSLADRDLTIAALRLVPLADSRRVGRFNLRDVEIANGTLPRPENAENVPDQTAVDAAFLDMDGARLSAIAAAVDLAHEQTTGLDAALDAAAGSAGGADLSALKGTLKSIRTLLATQLQRRGLGGGAVSEVASEGDGSSAPMQGGGVMAVSAPGTIQTREDIIRMLDRICDWYESNEPASPVPLLMRRAKRLVSKSFLELVQDLSPGGLSELQSIAGIEND